MLYDVESIRVEDRGGSRYYEGDYFKDFVVMRDYIEECESVKDLVRFINKFSSHGNWEISMDGKYKTRLKHTDYCGNIKYFSIRKIQPIGLFFFFL